MPNVYPGEQILSPAEVSQLRRGEVVGPLKPPSHPPISPPAGPNPQGSPFSSPKGFFGPGVLANVESRLTEKTPEQAYQKRVPQLATAAGILGSLVAPNPATFLGRLGVQSALGAGAGALGAAKEGRPAEIAKGTGTGAALGAGTEALATPARYFVSAGAQRILGSRTARQVSTWLKEQVPAWSGTKSGAKGLYDMARGMGQEKLSETYAKALGAAIKDIPEEATVAVPREVATAAGIKTFKASPVPPSGRGFAPDVGEVPARELATAIPSFGRERGSLKAEALSALSTITETIPALRDASRQYKLGQGWIDLVQKGGLLMDPNKLNMADLHRAMSKYGKPALLGRGMGPLGKTLWPGWPSNPTRAITKQQPNTLGWHLGLGTAGVLGGLGLHGLPGVGGGLAALTPRPTMYSGVPIQIPLLQRMRQTAVQGTIPQVTNPNGPQ